MATYDGTQVDFGGKSAEEIRGPILASRGPGALHEAAATMSQVADQLEQVVEDLHLLRRDYSSSHEGAAAEATRDYLLKLAQPGLDGVRQFNLASSALQDQGTYFTAVYNEVASAHPPPTTDLPPSARGKNIPAAVEWREPVFDAANRYQENTNHNLANWFQPFETPPAPQIDTSVHPAPTAPAWAHSSDASGIGPAAAGPAGGAAVPGATTVPGPPATAPGSVGPPGSSGTPMGVLTAPAIGAGGRGSAGAVRPSSNGGSDTGVRPMGADASRASTPAPTGSGSVRPVDGTRVAAPSTDRIPVGAPAHGGTPRARDVPRPGIGGRSGRVGGAAPGLDRPGARGTGSAFGAGQGGRPGFGAAADGIRAGVVHGEGPLQARPSGGGTVAEEGARPAGSPRGGSSATSSVPFMPGGSGAGRGGGEHPRPAWLVEDDPESLWLSGLPPHGPGVIRPSE